MAIKRIVKPEEVRKSPRVILKKLLEKLAEKKILTDKEVKAIEVKEIKEVAR